MDASAAQKIPALQSRNSKLAAELQVSGETVRELEQKLESLKKDHDSYMDTLLCVNRFWDQLEKELDDEASEIERALALRSGRLESALAHLLKLISSGNPAVTDEEKQLAAVQAEADSQTALNRLVEKRNAELDKEREAHLMLQREVSDLRNKLAAAQHLREAGVTARQSQGLAEELDKQRFLISSQQQQLDAGRTQLQMLQTQADAGQVAKRQLTAAQGYAAELNQQLEASRKAAAEAEAERGFQEAARMQAEMQQMQQQAAQTKSESATLRKDNAALKAETEDLRLFLEVLETFCEDPRELVEVRVSEVKLKKQLQALTENGNANHSMPEVSHEELLEARKRGEAAEAQVVQLREASREQQVQIASLQRHAEKLRQDCAAAKQDNEPLILEIEDLGQAYEASQHNNRSLTEQLTARDEVNANLVGERIREGHAAAATAEARDSAVAHTKRLAADLQDHKAHLARVESRLQSSLEESAALQARLREAEAALLGARGQLQQRDETGKGRDERLAEAERRAEELKRRAEEDASKEARERAKRMRVEDDAKALNSRLQQLQREAAGASNQQLQAELKAARSVILCKVCCERNKDTVITKCWHTFCKTCINKNLDMRHRKCPGCGTPFGQGDVKPVYLT
ncbi:hypothetical protein WJX73_004098 [Symbiochloris irregularis]|uniref:E3 ubiquitin protein ligase n=1 Tax=Symbiochloris irregularis TaxID=706552 RepID=A0AAW1PZ17_9CHLO